MKFLTVQITRAPGHTGEHRYSIDTTEYHDFSDLAIALCMEITQETRITFYGDYCEALDVVFYLSQEEYEIVETGVYSFRINGFRVSANIMPAIFQKI